MSKNNEAVKPHETRIEVKVSDALIGAIDNYRFATRAANRPEAVRRLLNAGRAPELARMAISKR